MNGNRALTEQQRREIGDRIRSLRKRNGLSQEDLALELGLNPSSLQAIEAGRSELKVSTLLAISDFFRVSTDWLLKGKDVVSFNSGYKITLEYVQ